MGNVFSRSEKGEVGQRPFIARYVLEPGKKQHCDHRSPYLSLYGVARDADKALDA